MPLASLKKNEFLDLVASEFISAHPPWRKVYEHRRHYYLAVGREFKGACFVWLFFSCRPDRYWLGHSVGWSPSESAFLHRLSLRENPPHYLTDGWLRRLRTLDSPRDFQSPEMSRGTSTLYRPYQDYNLETTPPEEVKALMLQEIEEYALPYLSMMLHARHGLELTAEQVGTQL